MPAKAQKPSTKTDRTPGVVLLRGPDAFLREEHARQIKERLEKEHGGLDVLRFDGASCQIGEVLDECRTPGLMTPHKLVIVDNADKFVAGDNRPVIERYTREPAGEATLVLRAERWAAGKLDDILQEHGLVVLCEAPDAPTAARWAVARASKRHGAELNEAAARELVELVGPDLGLLESELAKLASALPEGKKRVIDAALVRELTVRERDEEVWAIQPMLLSGDPRPALTHLSRLLDVAGAPETLVMYACLDAACKLHALAAARAQGQRPDDLAGPLKLWGPMRQAALGAAGRANPRRTAALVAHAVDLDRRVKTGLSEPRLALERLALEFSLALR